MSLVALLALAACGRGSGGDMEAEQAAPFRVDPADLVVVDSGTIETGPLLSGSLQPRQQATVRAEVGGTVLEVLVEPGQNVQRGAPLLRIDSDAPTENLESARAGVRSAENQVQVARRNVERNEELVKVGAVAERTVEDSRNQLSAVEAQLADARSRLTQAQKQVSNTRPVAPFTGVVSDRPVNAGDVVSPGAALASIIDPSTLRLVAAIPAEALSAVEVGASVQFQVTGYSDRRFVGTVERINPAADPVTRQITLYVDIPNDEGNLVAGLYAEGRVTSDRRRALVVPLSATSLGGEDAESGPILRVRQGEVERVDAAFGVIDRRTGHVEVLAGVALGDTVLVGPARQITPGTPVQVSGSGPGGGAAAGGES
jgi:RND family efflux transporter MFP subunit